MNPILPLWLRRLAWFSVAAWAITICTLSSISGAELKPFSPQGWDKVEHMIAFASGGAVLALALRWSFSWEWKRVAWVAVLSLAIFGALDELHQLYTPGRSGADPFDWMADCFGALFGVAGCIVIYARFFPPHRPASTGT